jgi:uncharacterized membrane protein
MSPRNALAESRRRRRLITAAWIIALSVVTISLIYWEKTAILYILATVGLSVLLLAVAFSDLHPLEKQSPENPSARE